MRALRRFSVRAQLPPALSPLQALATNLRWTWHGPTQDLFAAVDPEVWRATGGDPVRLLGEVRPQRLTELAADEAFVARVREVSLTRAIGDAHSQLRRLSSDPDADPDTTREVASHLQSLQRALAALRSGVS